MFHLVPSSSSIILRKFMVSVQEPIVIVVAIEYSFVMRCCDCPGRFTTGVVSFTSGFLSAGPVPTPEGPLQACYTCNYHLTVCGFFFLPFHFPARLQTTNTRRERAKKMRMHNAFVTLIPPGLRPKERVLVLSTVTLNKRRLTDLSEGTG